ncbi:hypothetical protein M0804_014703 [Polistes exclamans]|nr:hypothetical protein M0804_014704 [Polistes exclamans]KAI4474727.1 hypothetical protein M0804_014703 [Polistes exclamans]
MNFVRDNNIKSGYSLTATIPVYSSMKKREPLKGKNKENEKDKEKKKIKKGLSKSTPLVDLKNGTTLREGGDVLNEQLAGFEKSKSSSLFLSSPLLTTTLMVLPAIVWAYDRPLTVHRSISPMTNRVPACVAGLWPRLRNAFARYQPRNIISRRIL